MLPPSVDNANTAPLIEEVKPYHALLALLFMQKLVILFCISIIYLLIYHAENSLNIFLLFAMICPRLLNSSLALIRLLLSRPNAYSTGSADMEYRRHS